MPPAPPPPPLTPTAHRFLPTSNSRPKPTPTPRTQQQTPQSCSQQFVPTPRFSFTAGRRSIPLHHDAIQHPGAAGSLSSPIVSGILRHRPRLLVLSQEKAEDVDSEQEDEDEQQKENGHDDPITETNTNTRHSTPPSTSPLPHHKRRRLKPPSPTSTNPSSSPSLPSPSHPHFLTTLPLAAPPPPALPRFLLPSPASPAAPTALTFSPQRRAQKLVAGGLAASLRDLVVETAVQATGKARTARNPRARWDLRLRVQERRSAALGVGMVLVRAGGACKWAGGGDGDGEGMGAEREDCDTSKGQNWLLIGRSAHAHVTRGCTVGVQRPVWEVDVLGERWAVGVEWAVLQL